VKMLVDKVRRHKVTRLKKTILIARKKLKKLKSIKEDNPNDSGFETIESG